jgi:signal transduction histidine kinase
MGFNFVTHLQSCAMILQENKDLNYLNFIYYSHVPTALVSFLFGLFVFFQSRKNRASQLFFLISVLFSFWSLFDILLWTGLDSRATMFFWSIINLTENLVTVLTAYFACVFIEKKDISFKIKILFLLLFLPYVILLPTTFNIAGFNTVSCEAEQGVMVNYFYALETLFFTVTLVYLIKKMVQANKGSREQIVLFSIGILLFLASFSGANIAGSLAAIVNPDNSDNWKIIQYGLFGMPVFTGFLAYLIVRYEAFNIKLLAAQALVVALIALIGSQFFFIQNQTNKVLTALTLVISAFFGWILINSVKKEVERKDQLQKISNSLAKANERLKELDNTKSEFISIASHQLRTPLTAIKGYLSLVLEGSYGPVSVEVHDVLEKINAANGNLIKLVEDLLNVSRIETGRVQYRFEPVRLETLVKDVTDMFLPLAKDHGLELDINFPRKPLPELSLDAARIREAVANLIDNAIKYTQKGGVTVSVESNSYVARVIVSDTGVGIRQDEQENLFRKFVRSEESTKVSVAGTGLGLYVGKNFVEAHGGHIWAESDGFNKGSRFIIELPIRNPKMANDRVMK